MTTETTAPGDAIRHCPATDFNGLAAFGRSADLVTLRLPFSAPALRYLEGLDLPALAHHWHHRSGHPHNPQSNVTLSDFCPLGSRIAKEMPRWLERLFPSAEDPNGGAAFFDEFTAMNMQLSGTLQLSPERQGRFQILLPMAEPTEAFRERLTYHRDGPTGVLSLHGNATAYCLNPPDDILERCSDELAPDFQNETPSLSLHTNKIWHASPVPPAGGRLIFPSVMYRR